MSVTSLPYVTAQLLPPNIVAAFGDRTEQLDGQKTASATITADTISFADSNPDTILDSASGFITAGFRSGQKISVSGSASNDGTYTIATVAAGALTLIASDTLAVEAAGATVTVGTSEGTATDGQLYDNVQALSLTEIDTLFGSKSELVQRILQFRAGSDGYVRVDVIPKDDAAGATAADASVTFTGTATESASYSFSIVDAYAYTVSVDVLSGDTASDVGDMLANAINALARVPVVAINTAGVVTLIATNSGTVGNFYGLHFTGEVAGITVTTTAFANGATDPVLTDIFDVTGEQRYTGIGWPEWWQDELTIVIDFLEDRFNPDNAVLDGMAFHGRCGTYATVKAEADALNTKVLAFGQNNPVNTNNKRGQAILQPPDFAWAYFMGVRAKCLTTGVAIADDIISTTGPLDAIGGPSLASLPYFNTELKRSPVADPADLYTVIEQKELADSGFTVIGTNRTKTATVMSEVVTTWKTDSAGNTNVGFHYLNYVDTGSVCREILFNSAKAQFAQTRLTEGDLVERRSMENAESIKAHYMGVYRTLANLALVQSGREAEKFVSDNTVVTIDLANRSASVTSVLPIVTQLAAIDYVIQFNFSLTSGQQITF